MNSFISYTISNTRLGNIKLWDVILYPSLVLARHGHLLNLSCSMITIYFSAVHIYKSMNYEWWLCSFIPWRLTKWKHNKTTIRIIKRFLLTWLIWEGGAVLYQNKKCQYYRGAPKVVTVSPGKKLTWSNFLRFDCLNHKWDH